MIDDVFDILNITGQTTYYLLVLHDNMCKLFVRLNLTISRATLSKDPQYSWRCVSN